MASPVLVDVYLVGDFGLPILIGVVIGAIWVGHRFKSGMDEAQSGAEVPRVAPAHPSAPAAPGRHTGIQPNLTPTKNGMASRVGMPSVLARSFYSPECVEKRDSQKSTFTILYSSGRRLEAPGWGFRVPAFWGCLERKHHRYFTETSPIRPYF